MLRTTDTSIYFEHIPMLSKIPTPPNLIKMCPTQMKKKDLQVLKPSHTNFEIDIFCRLSSERVTHNSRLFDFLLFGKLYSNFNSHFISVSRDHFENPIFRSDEILSLFVLIRVQKLLKWNRNLQTKKIKNKILNCVCPALRIRHTYLYVVCSPHSF